MCIYYIPCNTSNHISTSAFEDGELESFPKTNSFAREKRSGCKKKVLPSWGLAQVQRCELLVPKSEKRLAVSYTKGRPLSNTDAQTVAPISALLRSRNRLLPKLSGGKLLNKQSCGNTLSFMPLIYEKYQSPLHFAKDRRTVHHHLPSKLPRASRPSKASCQRGGQFPPRAAEAKG